MLVASFHVAAPRSGEVVRVRARRWRARIGLLGALCLPSCAATPPTPPPELAEPLELADPAAPATVAIAPFAVPPRAPITLSPESFDGDLRRVVAELARTDRWTIPTSRAGYYLDVLEARLVTLSSKGISASRQDQHLLVRLSDETWFAPSSAELPPEARRALAPLGAALVEFDRNLVCVLGHTDDAGPDAVNQALSERRALAVARELVATGVPLDRVLTAGFGASRPMARNDDPRGRERNRRVDLLLIPIVLEPSATHARSR